VIRILGYGALWLVALVAWPFVLVRARRRRRRIERWAGLRPGRRAETDEWFT
jgi:hypothetical protein